MFQCNAELEPPVCWAADYLPEEWKILEFWTSEIASASRSGTIEQILVQRSPGLPDLFCCSWSNAILCLSQYIMLAMAANAKTNKNFVIHQPWWISEHFLLHFPITAHGVIHLHWFHWNFFSLPITVVGKYFLAFNFCLGSSDYFLSSNFCLGKQHISHHKT